MTNWSTLATWATWTTWDGDDTGVSTPIDVARLKELWPDGRNHTDDTLRSLILAAWEQCSAYLPAADLTAALADQPPARWAHANALQARDIFEAGRRDGDVIASEAGLMRARPLSATVAALLRPPTGRPGIG